MNPGIFFALSIAINVLVVYYLISYYYHPDRLAGPSGRQGSRGVQGKTGKKGPKGDRWKFETCDDVSDLITQVKDVLAPRNVINQRCSKQIWDDNGQDIVNIFQRTPAGARFISNFSN